MANRRALQHKYFPTLALGYDSYTSETALRQEPVIVDGQNILVSRRGWLERRPGSSPYESTATNGNEWKRIYTYKKWNGDTFLMANEVTSTQSKVYKLKVGTDTTFQLLSTFSTITTAELKPENVAIDVGGSPSWTISSSTSPNAVWPQVVWSSDDVRTQVVLGAAQTSERLVFFDFLGGFTQLPSGYAIVGITVKIELSASAANEIEDATVQLRNNANPTGFGSNKARAAGTYWPVTASEAEVTYGGAADTWGLTPTADDLNDGIGVIVKAKNKSGGAGATAYIDRIHMIVHASPIAKPFDFVTANDTCYYSNGVSSRKYDGSNERQWGVTPPKAPPTFTNAGSGITAVTGWYYAFAYVSESGHVSSLSPKSGNTGAITDDTITVTSTFSTDADIVSVRVYRTTDGGDGIFFRLGDVPNNTAGGTWTFADATPDSKLSTAYDDQSPPEGYNDPPQGLTGFKHWSNRIWGYKDNLLMFSGWEEINTGIEEESFPSDTFTGNRWYAPEAITNLAVVGNADNSLLLVFTRNRIFKISGSTREDFEFEVLFEDSGCAVEQNQGVAEDGERVFWFNVDRRIWVTDGNSKAIVSEAISDELAEIAFDDFSMVVHRWGEHNWLVVADNAGDTKGLLSTGPNSPSSASDSGANAVSGQPSNPWSNPSNATTSDNSYATATVSSTTSNWLQTLGYGFSIPSTAAIQGFVLEVESKTDAGTAALRARINAKSIQNGENISSSEAYKIVPSTTGQGIGTLWGYAGISPNTVNTPQFQMDVYVGNDSGATTVSVDHVRLTAYYTNGASSARWFVYDLSSGKWMPPWTISATYLHSAELATGQRTLLYISRDGATANTQVRKLAIAPVTSSYKDVLSSTADQLYSSNYVISNELGAPLGFVAGLDYLGYEIDGSKTSSLNGGESPVIFFQGDEESAAVTWSSSNVVMDELPSVASTAIAPATPTLFTPGTNIRERWAYINKPCRRALVRFNWNGVNQNFRHYALDYAFRLLGGED